MIDLKGKVVLVTGGGGGIGAATVRMVAKLGGAVVLHDVRAEGAAAKVRDELGAERCLIAAGDLAQDDAPIRVWQQAVAWKGRVDVLVNNAGVYESADIGDDFAAWSGS